MDEQKHRAPDDIQVTVPLRRLEQLLELPGEVAKLQKEVAQLKRRMDGVGGIHYDMMCKIQELKELI